MNARYINVDRETPMLLPCDLRDWVAEDDLVHFVLAAVEDVDLRGLEGCGAGRGSAQYPPRMLLGLLIHCYANGVFSSRQIERLTHQNVTVRFLCGNTHPDHDTISAFRARHQDLFQRSFTAVLRLARQLNMLQLGIVHLDGTKLRADASPRATRDAAALEAELDAADRQLSIELWEKAEKADHTESDRGWRLPPELASVAQRKARLDAARQALRERAAQSTSPRPTINLTDPDSRLMPQPQGGFAPGYNAQLAVEAHGVIVGQTVSQATNDRAELVATAAAIQVAPGEIEHLVMDQGYDNQPQIEAVEASLDTTVICPPQRSDRMPGPRRSPARAALSAKRVSRARIARHGYGQALLRERQTTIEPVFGALKHQLGFRRFHLRGLNRVRGEWSLVTTAWNCRQLWQRAVRARRK
jgi:transposase